VFPEPTDYNGPMPSIDEVAPAFLEMAHRIVWCTVATVSPSGTPSTRILHPIWQFDGSRLTGWIATSPSSPKAKDLEANPTVSLTYWDPTHDTCTATCSAVWETTPEERRAGWDRFVNAPAPVGYVPSIIPQWPTPDAPGFGILRLEPTSLRLMDGSLMLRGEGRMLTWRA
jgi:hypothetical protein